MASIVIVGKNSFLARRFLAHVVEKPSEDRYIAVAHDEAFSLDGADAVVNFAFDPRLRTELYDAAGIDLDLVNRMPPTARFIMPSSRMVYAEDQACGATEHQEPRGLNLYGLNKLRIERRLRDRLGDRLTVLRISNVVGSTSHEHRGHIGTIDTMIRSLQRDGQISLDVSPFVQRDFVTDRYVSDVIRRACRASHGGTFNLGSGFSTRIGQIARWLIEGYGRGEIAVANHQMRDEFWLDMTRTRETFGPTPDRTELHARCVELGKEAARR